MPKDATYNEYMKMSFELLSMCDTIYMMKGWEESKGANREYGFAVARGIKILMEERRMRGTRSTKMNAEDKRHRRRRLCEAKF